MIRPLIAPERFGSGVETREATSIAPSETPGWRKAWEPGRLEPKLNWGTIGNATFLTALKFDRPIRRLAGRTLGALARTE